MLQVFRLKALEQATKPKLVLVSEHHVAGTITALSRVKVLNSRSGGEAVLIAVRDAKLSLIEWDPDLHSISTTSIHYYESEDLQKNPWAPHISQCFTNLTVDPSSRCAAFNFGIQNLAILPFHQLGDDLVIGDYDPDFNSDKSEPTKNANEDSAMYTTPYASSFVLSLTTLDPGLLHPIDMAFLHEYREPTFGILYSNPARSQALAHERKDVTNYAVFTLDLEQKASTTLLSILKLPNDLHKVLSLPAPVGGALLVGGNELIHVDQGGKTNAIAVNDFARQCSAFPMSDNSSLNLRLEDTQVVSLGVSSPDLLLILPNGTFLLLAFKLDGRTVSSIYLQPLRSVGGMSLMQAGASCAATLAPGLTFIGSEEADSLLLGWNRTSPHLRRQSSRVAMADGQRQDDDEREYEDDLDDDLYGPSEDMPQRTRSLDAPLTQDIDFMIHDRLVNLGPIRDVTFGTNLSFIEATEDTTAVSRASDLEMMVSSGKGSAGSVTIMGRELDIRANRSTSLEGANGIWSVQIRKRNPDEDLSIDDHDQYMIVSSLRPSGGEESDLYRLTTGGMEVLEGTEFDPSAGGTIAVGSVAQGTRVVQVLSGELKSYDATFGLSQIHPIVDEDMGAVAKVVNASFADPYVLVVRDDSTIVLLQADMSGDLEECELNGSLLESKWLSGCLYTQENGVFGNGTKLFLLGADGGLYIYDTSSLAQPIYVNKGIPYLPSKLSSEPLPKHWREQATITEVLVADLGDDISSSPHMLLRTSTDDVVIYEPYCSANEPSDAISGTLAFKKIPNHVAPKSPSGAAREAVEADTVVRSKPFVVVPNFAGLKSVFIPGSSPAVIIKTATSMPQMYSLRLTLVKALSSFNTADCPNGFAFIDESGYLISTTRPKDTLLGVSPWVICKRNLGMDVTNLSFFPRQHAYVLATSETANFQLPQDDEWHPDWQEEQLTMPPLVERSTLRVLSRTSLSFTSAYRFEPDERIMCLKTLNLEVSEITHERKDLVVVGTAVTRGEDISTRGGLYIFDIVDVVPEPDIDETDMKLKLIAKEDVKGAVTSVSQVGSQGYLIAAQGQKCMVRGLKEDNTILPVAFLDMNYYVNVIKELKGTGLCILGDACHGLWFTGYSEEPYKLQVLGKDVDDMEVMAADFLPIDRQLYIVSADGNGDLHVFQYDPENPKSSRGTELLHRSTFHTGYFPTSVSLIPRTPVSSELAAADSVGDMDVDVKVSEQQLLLTSQEGAIALITPLSEQAYRRLSTLQNLLVTNLEHPCGLNPRAYRSAETDGVGGRAMLDGNLLRRWLDQSSQYQASLADRIGATIWDVRGDIEAVCGAGLGYI